MANNTEQLLSQLQKLSLQTKVQFYIVGGITGRKSDLLYNVQRKSWTFIPFSNRAYCYAVSVKGMLYLIGGRDENNLQKQTVLKYTDKSWLELPLKLMVERSESAAVVYNNCIYITGGFDRAKRSVEIYNLEKNSQRYCPLLQLGRWGHSVHVIEDRFYVVGGHDKGRYHHQVESWCPGDGKWVSCNGMNRRRAYFASATVGSFIYVFGGFGGVHNTNDKNRISCAERFDIKTGEWAMIKSLPSARSNMSAVVLDGKVLIIGGIDDSKQKLQEILSYDIVNDTYTSFTIEMVRWRFAHSSVVF